MGEVATQKPAQGLSFAVPAHIAARLKAAGGGNIADKSSVNQLTFGGKAWLMHVNGEKKLLQRVNDDGDMENVSIIKVVVLDQAAERGRDYYEKPFNPLDPKGPDCWSADSVKPHASVQNPQAGSCSTCPMAPKGSKVGEDGQQGYACAMFKLLSVIPVHHKTGQPNFDFPVLRLKLRMSSIWDKRDEAAAAEGWYGWDNYCDLLRQNGLSHTGAVTTRVRFANVNYPKLQFKMGEFLDDEMFDKALARAGSDEVKKLVAGGYDKPAAPKLGKPLPKDDEEVDGPAPVVPASKTPDADTIAAAQKLRAAEEAAAAKHAAEAETARLVANAKEVAAGKAKAIADAKAAYEAALAQAAAEEGFDDGAASTPAPVVAAPAQTTRKRRTKEQIEADNAAKAAAQAAPQSDDEPPARARNVKPELDDAPKIVPQEVSNALSGVLGAWGG